MNLLQLILVLIAFKKIEYGKATTYTVPPHEAIITAQGKEKGVELTKATMINQRTVELSCFKYNGSPKARFIASDNNGIVADPNDGKQNTIVYGAVLQNPEGKCGDMPKYSGKTIYIVLPGDQYFTTHVSKLLLVDEDNKTILLYLPFPSTAKLNEIFCPKLKAGVCSCFSDGNNVVKRKSHCPHDSEKKQCAPGGPGDGGATCAKDDRKDSSEGCLVSETVKNAKGECGGKGGGAPTSPGGSTGAQKSKLNKISLFFIMIISIINLSQ